ncbi:MAG: phosphatase PAP2 family protein [Candidatus Gracilibacteria bacterium]|nr:phosphatase PAP2 family protein [Candidatus Peregrinibacteria bacterium]
MNVKTKIFSAILLVTFIVALVYDAQIVQFVESQRNETLNRIMYLLTDLGLFFILSGLATYLIYKRRYTELLLMAAAALLSLETAYILKKLFQVPRPDNIAVEQLTHATGWAFPSIHAAIVLSLAPFMKRTLESKPIRGTILALLILIAVSRMYLGVHYLSDIIFGGFLGYILALTLIYLEQRYQIAERFIYHLQSKREVRRQSAHLTTGLLIILLVKLNVLNTVILGAILAVGGILSLISRYTKIPIIYQILRTFERPKQMKTFPGKGSFFLVMGSFLALILFPEPVALASIAIMAIGDSLTTLIGVYFGHIKSPTNNLKHLEGTALAIIAGTIAAFNFVSFEKAFIGTFVAMLFEALTIRHIDRVIDDNLLIPIVAGLTMTLIL